MCVHLPRGLPASVVRRCLIPVGCLLLMLALPAGSAHSAVATEPAAARKQVLVLHAYHQGYLWTDEITRGIRAAFAQSSVAVDLSFDYMDTKRQDSPAYRELLRQLFQARYATRKPDLVIAADDNAFSFMLDQRQALFGGYRWFSSAPIIWMSTAWPANATSPAST